MFFEAIGGLFEARRSVRLAAGLVAVLIAASAHAEQLQRKPVGQGHSIRAKNS